MKTEIEKYAGLKLRALMKERRVTTNEMCKLLNEKFGISLEDQSFNNKITRSNFNATFLFQCMFVLNIRELHFDIGNILVSENKTTEKKKVGSKKDTKTSTKNK
jgi:hypothetical protein